MSVEWIAALSSIFATILAGGFAWIAKKQEHKGPESVAGGYSKLVESLHQEVKRLSENVERSNSRVGCLERKVNWLINRVTPEDRLLFDKTFPRKEH